MKELEEILQRHSHILFVGVGNVLRGDDAAGVFLTSMIHTDDQIRTLIVETGIENYVGKINKLAPDLTIIVDAAHLAESPGSVRLCDPSDTINTTTHTHNIALGNLAKFFSMPCLVLCIQPATLHIGAGISPPVLQVCTALADRINKCAATTS